ncbi:hypothetical protein EBX93_00760 [bacterium]|nr:hypothetical protein [bacterium]
MKCLIVNRGFLCPIKPSASLQIILNQIIFKKSGSWVKITVNVADYWQKREDQLKHLADNHVSLLLRNALAHAGELESSHPHEST